ncbi:MAG: FAD-binding protein [candidate division KSB1 bacterium]|nr:FAD-binding protein [candidate division KSB1 bacterium]MDZ7294563.1 FAD-binding protein [candidate division KSB1 bacterium]MDZ7392391.1 FAD-binding protein [candidate division KSB1 bacterium]MDZ7414069.1 FAD-binding protein [candidate division KSB1 bacterium]
MLSSETLKNLRKIVGKENVLTAEVDLLLYEYDGSMDAMRPDVVVFAHSTHEVSQVLALAHRHGIPCVPRGSGTNLSGGSVPARGGIVLELSRMNRILEIDTANQRAVVEPGVYNLDLQNALAPLGFFYAPDPASQKVSTIGGNVAENAGGPHCLKYGVTTNHVLGLEVVLADGRVCQLGGKALDVPGYDLVGTLVGSEGTLCVFTKIVVRIMPLPQQVKTLLAIFDSLDHAADAVSDIIGRGIVPATLEMMDRLTIQAVEASLAVGYPTDAEAVLVIEVDGPAAGLEAQAREVSLLCTRHGAREVRLARDEQERQALWAGRRGAFGAMTRVRPSIMVADGTVPREKLPAVLREVGRIARKYRLQHANLLHAGDGNLHPNLMFDARDPDERQRVIKASHEILEVCVAVGGTISGEHGIGLEKIAAMSLVFREEDMEAMFALKRVFDPRLVLNPGKIFPEHYYGRGGAPA